MWQLTRIELFKIFQKPRTYIAFGAIAAIIFLVQLALYIDGEIYLGFLMQSLNETFDIEGKKLNGYFLQDLQLHYSIHKKIIKTAELVLQVNNVWNKKYEANGYTFSYLYNNSLVRENFYYPMAGTNFLLALNVDL